MFQEKDDNIGDDVPMDLDLETKIVEIAEDVIKKHHILIMDDLYYNSTRILKTIDKRSIQNAIAILIKKKVLFPRATLTKTHVLDNKSRASIYDTIKRQPGIHMSKIRRLLDMGSNVVIAHLVILEKFDIIRSKTVANNVIYFDINMGSRFDKFYYYLHKGDTLEILKLLLDQPCNSFTDLYTRLSRPRSTLTRKIDILEAEGLLILTRESNKITSIRINDDYREILITTLKDGAMSEL